MEHGLLMFIFLDTLHMDSNYIIKVFDKDSVFKRTVSWKNINGDIRFTSVINSWFSSMSLTIQNKRESVIKETVDTGGGNYYQTAEYWSNIGIEHGDIIKIVDPNKNIATKVDTGGGDFYVSVQDQPIYSWIVIEISHNILSNWESHNIEVIGIQSYLNYVLYTNWSSNSFTKNADPSDILKEIIDLVPYLSYTGSSIETYWSSLSIEFDNLSCMESVKQVIDTTGRLISYDADWVVYFYEEEASPTPDHKFALGREIVEVNDSLKSHELYNSIILHHKNAWAWHDHLYEDLTSQSTYWVREKYIEKLSIENEDTADIFASAYFSRYAYPIQELSVSISNKYDISSVKVGDTVKINWYYNATKVYYIYKLDFTPSIIRLQLNEKQSLEKTLLSLRNS